MDSQSSELPDPLCSTSALQKHKEQLYVPLEAPTASTEGLKAGGMDHAGWVRVELWKVGVTGKFADVTT